MIRNPAAVRRIDWYFDLISPFSYLQMHSFGKFPADAAIEPRPVLFGAILKHWGQLGPAEIEPKRLQTYRLCQWVADRRGIAFRMPERHPFNPLRALRVLAALGPDLAAVRTAFEFVFVESLAPDTDERLVEFGRRLGVDTGIGELAASLEAKDALRRSTEDAIAKGVFGVPTLGFGGELFWGEDATGMALDYLDDPALFSNGEMARLAALPVGVRREAVR